MPKTHFKPLIDFNSLLEVQELVVIRRSDKSTKETFNELCFLRDDIINPERLPGLSMNLFGGSFKTIHIKFKPLKFKKAIEVWKGNEKIFLSDYLNGYEILEVFCPIFYCASDLHNKTIPYTKPYDKDAEKLMKIIKMKFDVIGSEIIANSKIELVHSPTYLNYWHVELILRDSNSNVIKKINNQYQKSISDELLSHFLTVKCKNYIPNDIKKIDKLHFYLKK